MSLPILVVDDDRFFREVATDLLTQMGHRVVSAENATRALEAYAQESFGVVLTDLVMPGVDGLQLIACLREHRPDQEVILVSERRDLSAPVTALRAGVSDYLVKPIDHADLKLAVDRCLERARLRLEREKLLDENQEFARSQSLVQRCLEFLSNPDLEWLQERILSELASLSDAQSGALWVADERGEMPLRAYRGLVDRHFLAEKQETQGQLHARWKEGAPILQQDAKGQAQLWVPLVNGGDLVAVAQLSDPLQNEFRPETLRYLRTVADFAAAAVKNGRRILSLQKLGLRDRDTAAYNLSYFTDYASKEIYKARRYGRTFSLLTFSIDNLQQARARLGADDARRATRGIIRALSRIVRDSDVIAKASDQEFYVMLPETDFFGALMFVRRAVATVRAEPDVKELDAKLPLSLVSGAATFPKDGDDFDELIHRCRRRMEDQRSSLQRKLHLDGLSFWEEVDLLLGTPQSPKLPQDKDSPPSRRGKVADVLFGELQAEVAREVMRDPQARGLLYVGGPEVRASLPIVSVLEGSPELSSRVYVLGRRADLDGHSALTPVFLEGDDRIFRHEFLLWLSENAAYALIQRPGKGATWGFHTSDQAVVDGLISTLQAEYDLQPY